MTEFAFLVELFHQLPNTELKAFQQPSLFCVLNYPGSSCVALESDGERTAEGTSALFVYGYMGIKVCEIPVVEL